MTVVQHTIQALTTIIKVSVVLSGAGTRKVFPDSNTAQHPLSFHSVSSLVLAPTELAFVDFDNLVRTTDHHGAAKWIHFTSKKENNEETNGNRDAES